MKKLDLRFNVVPFSIASLLGILTKQFINWETKQSLTINGEFFYSGKTIPAEIRMTGFSWEQDSHAGYIIVTTADNARHTYPLNGIYQFNWVEKQAGQS